MRQTNRMRMTMVVAMMCVAPQVGFAQNKVCKRLSHRPSGALRSGNQACRGAKFSIKAKQTVVVDVMCLKGGKEVRSTSALRLFSKHGMFSVDSKEVRFKDVSKPNKSHHKWEIHNDTNSEIYVIIELHPRSQPKKGWKMLATCNPQKA